VVDVAEHMHVITHEARRVLRVVPASLGLELADLVAAGAAHTLEGLRMSIEPGPALVRVYARQGMLAEVRRWGHGTKQHPVHRALLVEYDESAALPVRRATPAPPIELMIDLLRALLRLRLAHAYSWVTCRLHGDDLDVAARELGHSAASVRGSHLPRAVSALRADLQEWEPKPAKSPHQRAVELFRRGESCAFVAKALRMSETKAAQIQDSIDPLAKRRRAAQAHAMRHERQDIKLADIIALRREGLTEQRIADQLGCGLALVNRRLKKNGLSEGRVDSLRKRGLRPLAKCAS
jgi:hypothetical protein